MATSSSAFASFLVVTPEQVSTTPEGLFVNLNGISVAVESLNIANNGYIVAIPRSNADNIYPNCGYETYTPGKTCSTCGFPIWDGDMKKFFK